MSQKNYGNQIEQLQNDMEKLKKMKNSLSVEKKEEFNNNIQAQILDLERKPIEI
jgi:hypothetical protein